MRRRRKNPIGSMLAQVAISVAGSVAGWLLIEWWRRRQANPQLPKPVVPGSDHV